MPARRAQRLGWKPAHRPIPAAIGSGCPSALVLDRINGLRIIADRAPEHRHRMSTLVARSEEDARHRSFRNRIVVAIAERPQRLADRPFVEQTLTLARGLSRPPEALPCRFIEIRLNSLRLSGADCRPARPVEAVRPPPALPDTLGYLGPSTGPTPAWLAAPNGPGLETLVRGFLPNRRPDCQPQPLGMLAGQISKPPSGRQSSLQDLTRPEQPRRLLSGPPLYLVRNSALNPAPQRRQPGEGLPIGRPVTPPSRRRLREWRWVDRARF